MYKQDPQITIDSITYSKETILLDFGTNWCGFCNAAAPYIESALKGRTDIKHIQVEDGPGRKLGRHFKVKLWPTLILIKDGAEIKRIVRPGTVEEAYALFS